MPADPALLAQCARRATTLARQLRADPSELDASREWGDGAQAVADVAQALEKIAALAMDSPGQPDPSSSPIDHRARKPT